MARLAAFDIDGTLFMPDHHLGEKTLSTSARLRERRQLPSLLPRGVMRWRCSIFSGRYRWMHI